MMEPLQNPHAQHVYESIKKHAGCEAAESILSAVPLGKSPNETQKERWVNHITQEIETRFDSETINKIRMGCSCGPPSASMKTAKELFAQSSDLEDFARRSNAKNPGVTVWVEGGALFHSYPACYCSLVKHRAIEHARTWCLCTAGYTQRLYEYALGRSVDAELLESIKMGNDRCVVKVIPQ